MNNQSSTISFLSKMLFRVSLGTLCLLPVFFIPFVNTTLEVNKGFILAIGTLAALSFWIIARLLDGHFVVPKDKILLALAGLPVVFLAAGIFSKTPLVSLFGQGFEIGTFGTILTLSILMFLTALVFQNNERVSYLYTGLLGGSVLIGLFQIVRLFVAPTTLSLGFFGTKLANTVGAWNDLAIFFGFTALISLITLEYISVKKLFKILLYSVMIISLFMLALVNFLTAWIFIGIFSLVLFIYGLSLVRTNILRAQMGEVASQDEKTFPLASFIVTFVCLLFIFGNSFVGGLLSSQFNISATDVRPSVVATFDVAKQTLVKSPVIGSGPNRFVNEWLMYKPTEINNTIFWDTNFIQGFGLIPSFFVTTGILGIIAWLTFLAFFVYRGVKAMFADGLDKFSSFMVTSSFLGALYLWLISLFYIPSITIFALAFAMTGVFVGILSYNKLIPSYDVSFLSDPRNSFFSILALVLLMIVTLGGVYQTSKNFASTIYFGNSVVEANTYGDLNKIENSLMRALQLNQSDVYYRALSEVYLSKLALLIANNKDALANSKTDIQALLGKAEQAAQFGVAQDKTNYLNWVSLGRVYQAVVPLQVQGSYDGAKTSYEKALALNPNSPALLLMLARLEIDNKSNISARGYITQALAQKANYTEAIFLLSQIEASEGNVSEAIRQAEQASFIAPNDVGVMFQLGLLYYNNKDYGPASKAFERAITLSPDYLNARYYLGLSYEKLGRQGEALTQFNYIDTKSPGNASIQEIISNLQSGKSSTPLEVKDDQTKTPAKPKN